jgi:threonyl-tRNA synthetase
MVKISLQDGSVREYPAGTTLLQVAENISPKLAKNAVAALFNGEVTDLSCPIDREWLLGVIGV